MPDKLHISADTGKLILHPADHTKLVYNTHILCRHMVLIWQYYRFAGWAYDQSETVWGNDVDAYDDLSDAACCDASYAVGLSQIKNSPGVGGSIPDPAYGGVARPSDISTAICGRADMPGPGTLLLEHLQRIATLTYGVLGDDPLVIDLQFQDYSIQPPYPPYSTRWWPYRLMLNKNGLFDEFEIWLHEQWPDAEIYRGWGVGGHRWLDTTIKHLTDRAPYGPMTRVY
jgi:hypothetical protein